MNSNSKILIKLNEIEERLEKIEKRPKLDEGMLKAIELFMVSGENVLR